MKIDIGTLKLTKRHINNVVKALESNRLSYGPMTDEFEKKFARLHNNKYGIFTNSGTSALQAVIHAMKILYGWEDGDEIIIPATTFVATYNVILHNNMKPVLVDVGLDFNIEPPLIEEKITKRTRAIMPVHLLGKPCDMKAIMKVAKKHNLKVIEDSCEAMGIKGLGQGDVACFSFYIAHILITGVGGIAITKDKKLADLVRSLIFHGRDNKYMSIDDDNKYSEEVIHSRFKFNYPGYSSRGTEVEAALGLVELQGLSKNIQKRQANAAYLNNKLKLWDKKYMKGHAFMMFPILSDRRNALMLFLEKKGITTRTVMPLINQPYIKVDREEYPQSSFILEAGLLIGSHQNLTRKDLDYIVDSINEFYDRS